MKGRVHAIDIVQQHLFQTPSIGETDTAIEFDTAVLGRFGHHEKFSVSFDEKRIGQMVGAFQHSLRFGAVALSIDFHH